MLSVRHSCVAYIATRVFCSLLSHIIFFGAASPLRENCALFSIHNQFHTHIRKLLCISQYQWNWFRLIWKIFSHLSVQSNRVQLIFCARLNYPVAPPIHITSHNVCTIFFADLFSIHNLIKIEIFPCIGVFVNIQQNAKQFLITFHNAIYAKTFLATDANAIAPVFARFSITHTHTHALREII